MFPFLALPREIRDLIYIAILNTETTPPTKPKDLHMAREPPSPGWHSQCNRYSLLAPTVSAGPLLLTCPQVEAEVTELIDRLKSSKQLRYKLDVVVENELYMYPTWTCIPALSSHVDLVEVDFRMVGASLGPGRYASRFEGGDGGPGYMAWSLLELMTNFLHQGPNAMVHYLPEQLPRTSIGLIRINVVCPKEGEEGFVPLPDDGVKMAGERGDEERMRPEDLFWYIASALSILMNQGRKEVLLYCPHATTVFRGVQKIEARFEGLSDGLIEREWDVRESAWLKEGG